FPFPEEYGGLLQSISSGPDGTLWVTDTIDGGKIGRVGNLTGNAECSPEPAGECSGVGQGHSTITLREAGVPAARRCSWNWLGVVTVGSATRDQFGDPVTGSTSYAICIYDDRNLKSSYHVLAGGSCGASPCWSARPRSFTYRKLATDADGISKL